MVVLALGTCSRRNHVQLKGTNYQQWQYDNITCYRSFWRVSLSKPLTGYKLPRPDVGNGDLHVQISIYLNMFSASGSLTTFDATVFRSTNNRRAFVDSPSN